MVDLANDLVALVQQVVGRLPVAGGAGDLLSFTEAICWARLLMVLALFCSCSETAYWISLMRSAEERMRAAVSSMRVSTRVRADRSVGEATTSENAFIMSVMAARQPGAAAAEDFLQLREAFGPHRVGRAHRAGSGRLASEQLVLVAQDGGHVHALLD